MKKKICVVTGTRADYGLLYWLMNEIQEDLALELQVVVTCMHLSPEFGLTYKQIEADGFRIDRKVEMLLSSDTPVGVSKSMGLAEIGFADAFADLKPEMVVVLGDRYELLSAVSVAMVARIPVAHIHGGETTEGAIDEAIRHSITKMSYLHFTTTEEHRKRVIQLGEQPERVFDVGAPGLENLTRLQLLSKSELESKLDFRFGKKNLLITFHSVTLEEDSSADQYQNLLDVLLEMKDAKLIFTKTNSDTHGRIINAMIDEFVERNRERSVAFTSMGQIRYLSTLQFLDAVVGNSSSGIIEAPSFKIGTIDIGDRQRGRIRAKSVIDCKPDRKSICVAFEKLYSIEFQNRLQSVTNPYFKEDPSKVMMKIMKKTLECQIELKKRFYNVEF